MRNKKKYILTTSPFLSTTVNLFCIRTMYFKNELDFMPGIYKCSGDIENLRFKVRLEIIKSSMIPLSSMEEPESGSDPQYFEREELEFGWNEKIFNTHELDFYAEDRHFKSALDQEYYEQRKNLSSNMVTSSHRLFTYTSKDEIPPSLHRNVYKSEDIGNFCLLTDTSIRKKFKTAPDNWNDAQDTIVTLPTKNIIDYNPSEALRHQNRTLSCGHEIMYVVADFCDKTQKRETKGADCMNYLLFTITWNKLSLTLSIFPDFASFNTSGYEIDVDRLGDTRYVYRYWLMNISPIEEPSIVPCAEKFNEQVTSHQKYHFNFDIELPIRNTQALFVFLEIQKAFGFQCDNMFIRYYIDLKRPWTAEAPQLLHGITQQCRSKKDTYVTFFAHLFEFKLLQDLTKYSDDDDAVHTNNPQIFLEICSLDNWKRFRVEGYAWMLLPLEKGYHKMILNSWRPASCSQSDQLKRFFIGMDHEIADITYPGVPSEINSALGRYGFTTISSGSVQIVANVVEQNSTSVSRIENKHSSKALKTNKLMNNVNNILEAFKKAREKMLLVRDPVICNNLKN